MGSIIGIPSTRVSDMFIRQRVVSQMLSDQIELLRLQTQLSTGRRIQIPSEDPDAALRIIALQRLLERKDQIKTNLQTGQSYLTATDTALSTVSGSLAEIRGAALGAVGTTVTDTQREAVALQVEEMIRYLLDVGNQKFRDRYLFAGTGSTVEPFETTGSGLVQYLGNEGWLSSYSDINLLFDTNLHGSEVFGAISQPVLGTADLDPILTFDTRLADLRGGLGIARGSIAISDGSNSSTIDLSSAETIGDVAALIRANSGTITLDLEMTPTGLTIAGAPGDLLTIREVGGGTTAQELGLLTTTPTNTIVGNDLDPILRLTTRLDNLLGTRSYAVVRSGGADNDIIFEADRVGAASNEIKIVFVDDGSVVMPGVDEVASYDSGSQTLTVTVKTGETKAQHVVAAVEAAYDPVNMPFTARLDPLDEQNGGRGIVDVIPPGQTETAGGSGTAFDKDSGLQIVNGGITHVLSFAAAETVEDVLNILNASAVGVLAEINQDATGIDIRSRINGADFMIGENGGDTATQLGLRTFMASTRLEDLNYGGGVIDRESSGTPASAAKTWTGENNDLVFWARNVGPAWNGFAISFVEGVPPGTESFTYDPVAKTMVFEISSGSTTANDVIALLATDPQAAADFTVELDTADGSPNDGTGLAAIGGAVTTSGGAMVGTDFTITLADGTLVEIDLSANDGSGFVAATDSIAPPEAGGGSATSYATVAVESTGLDNGLTFQAKNLGAIYNGTKINFQENPGAPAAVVAYTAGVELTFDFDPTVTTAQDIIDALQVSAAGADFSATLDSTDGSAASTVGHVLDLINQDDNNVNPSTGQPLVQARLATYGNGIELIDLSGGSGQITVTRSELSTAAIALGLIPEGQQSTSGGTAEATATGRVESPGADNDLVFTAVQSGTASNVQIVFNPLPGGPIALRLAGNVLTVDYDPGVSTANDIVAAAAADPDFTAALATTDNDGSGNVDATGSATMAGGSVNSLATATVTFTGSNNEITFSAQSAGSTLNDTVITFNGVPAGPIDFTHDPVARTLQIDYDSTGGSTAQEIVDALRAHPLGALGGVFSASLSPSDGNANAGTGFVATVLPVATPSTSGGSQTLTGSDVNPLETEGIFTALVRLYAALKTNDLLGIERTIELLDQQMVEMNFSRAELGARQQGLDSVQLRLESEEVDLQAALSEDLDADLIEVISDFTARQLAFEAAMRSSASIFRMTLLDYL
jgi:flagellin-like hook-associated protein FlgL